MLCPCGSGLNFEFCCQPFIAGRQLPQTAEQLMRSRYSAYATKAAQYLFDTYTAESQVNQTVSELQQWAEQTHWLHLAIVNSENVDQQHAQVSFKAQYIHQNTLCELCENSSFVLEQEQWRYHTGDILAHHIIKKLKRNDLCPCHSGKKFKKCCADVA